MFTLYVNEITTVLTYVGLANTVLYFLTNDHVTTVNLVPITQNLFSFAILFTYL
jgi:hypothetical protein